MSVPATPATPAANKHVQHKVHKPPEPFVIRAMKNAKAITAHQLAMCGNISKEEYEEKARRRQEATEIRSRRMKDPQLTPEERFTLHCSHRREWGRTLFACPTCWLLPNFCVCEKIKRFRPKTKVILHLHHDEWWLGSNTGCVAHQTLHGSEMLMKGYPADDARFAELWQCPHSTTALLWPDDDAISVSELRERAARQSGGRIQLIGIDATWKGARTLLHSYHPSMTKVKLDADAVFAPGHSVSLLAPLREYRSENQQYSNRACTLEAVAAALRALEDDESIADGLLFNLKFKVNALLRQKCRIEQDDLETCTGSKAGYKITGQPRPVSPEQRVL